MELQLAQYIQKCKSKISEIDKLLEDDALRPYVRQKYIGAREYWEEGYERAIVEFMNSSKKIK